MKKFLCIFLSLCTLLALTVIATAQNPPALYLEQAGVCEPGQEISIAVCISDTEIAGGFISVQYDASLFVLKKVELLQAADALSMTYASKDGTLNVLLDGVQNIAVSGQLIILTFAASEEIQPGSYPISCTVPDAASFYALDESGTALSLDVQGCQGELQITAPVLPPCPARYLACQETAVVGGTFALRLCALVADASAICRSFFLLSAASPKRSLPDLLTRGEGGASPLGAECREGRQVVLQFQKQPFTEPPA